MNYGQGCTGSGDSAYLQSLSTNSKEASTFGDIVKNCTLSCAGSASTAPKGIACISQCISGKSKLSADCSTCYGLDALCAYKHCLAACLTNPVGKPCADCRSCNCEGPASTCKAGSGKPVDAGPWDAGPVDAGPVDAGPVDAGPVDAGPVDTGVDPCKKCAANETCSNGKCVPKTGPPCGGKCPVGEICDKAANGGAGKCVKMTCKLPTKWSPHINRITKLAMATKTTGACDLNSDGKPDNAFGKGMSAFAAQLSSGVNDALKDGSLTVLFEPDAWKTDGKAFAIRVLDGAPVKGKPNAYLVKPASYDMLFNGAGQCPAAATMPATVNGLKLQAGGTKSTFPLPFPLLSFKLDWNLSGATLKADVQDKTTWKASTNGTICGYIKKSDIDAAVDKIPDAELKKQGFDKATVKAIIGGVLKADLDVDQDGTNESVSAFFMFESAKVPIDGLTP